MQQLLIGMSWHNAELFAGIEAVKIINLILFIKTLQSLFAYMLSTCLNCVVFYVTKIIQEP